MNFLTHFYNDIKELTLGTLELFDSYIIVTLIDIMLVTYCFRLVADIVKMF